MNAQFLLLGKVIRLATPVVETQRVKIPMEATTVIVMKGSMAPDSSAKILMSA